MATPPKLKTPADLGEFVKSTPRVITTRNGEDVQVFTELSFGQDQIIMQAVISILQEVFETQAMRRILNRAMEQGEEFEGFQVTDILSLTAEGAHNLPAHLGVVAAAILDRPVEFVQKELSTRQVFDVVAPFLRERWGEIQDLAKTYVPNLLVSAQADS
jgi:hypothetical protein